MDKNGKKAKFKVATLPQVVNNCAELLITARAIGRVIMSRGRMDEVERLAAGREC